MLLFPSFVTLYTLTHSLKFWGILRIFLLQCIKSFFVLLLLLKLHSITSRDCVSIYIFNSLLMDTCYFQIPFPFFFLFGCAGSSLLQAGFLQLQQWGSSLLAAHRLLLVAALLAAEGGLQGAWAAVVVALVLSSPAACGLFLGQGQSPCPLCGQEESRLLHHQGCPVFKFLWLLMMLR